MTRFRLVSAYPQLGVLFRPWLISNLYEGLIFLVKHRRWPNFDKTGYLNDLLFRMRASESDMVFRSFTADKEFSKIYIRGITGEDLSVPTLAVLHSAEEIDRFVFPDRCVIKPTHMSKEFMFHETGPVTADKRAQMRHWLKMNFGDMTGERHYMRLEPKVIVEPWLRLNGDFCNDYRFHMYKGQLTSFGIGVRDSADRETLQLQLTPDWKLFPGESFYQGRIEVPDSVDIESLRPDCLPRMLEIAELVSRDVDYVRVDFFTDGRDQLYVGEISHIIAGAREVFKPVELERVFTTPPAVREGFAE